MSSNSSNSVGTQSLGARVNFFDSQTESFDLSREPKDPSKPTHDHDDGETETVTVDELLDRDRGSHEYVNGVNRESWVAGSLLRSYDNPPLFCPECWHRFDVENQLSDPEDHLPLVEVDWDFDGDGASAEVSKNDHRRHRHCPECGVVSFGGVLGDREIETFVEIVEWFLDSTEMVPPSRRKRILEASRTRKERNQSDSANMERVVREVRYNLEPENRP